MLVAACAVYAQIPNVSGRVTSTDGSPVAGAVVSDGLNCTQTDSDGRYTLTSDLENRHFIMLSVPAEYEIPARHSLPIPFKRIPRYVETFTADFVLEPRKESSDHHTLIVQGDPQIKDFFWDNSAEAYRDVVIPDIIKTRKSIATPCYGIELGDVIYNELTVYPVYLHNTDRVNMVTFNVIGNHDHDQTTLLKDSLGTMHYEMHLGPTCYSANIGRVHYIFIDDILYDRKDAKESYRHGLYDETVHWLIEDLKYVPKDKIIMICAHAQMFNKKTTMVRRNKNFAAYSKALLDFKYVYSWAGHNHHTYLYTSEPERNYDIDNLTSITVTKSTGALRLNRLLNNDGTPQGYFVVDVDGEEVSWYYLCCGKDRNYQMKVYPPARTGGEYVMANIWAHDNKWGAVEWWENGVKVGQMEAHDALDPDYVDLYATVTNKTTRKYCKPVNSFHMFQIKPSEGIREGEVRVTDRFGNLYTQKVSW